MQSIRSGCQVANTLTWRLTQFSSLSPVHSLRSTTWVKTQCLDSRSSQIVVWREWPPLAAFGLHLWYFDLEVPSLMCGSSVRSWNSYLAFPSTRSDEEECFRLTRCMLLFWYGRVGVISHDILNDFRGWSKGVSQVNLTMPHPGFY